MPRARIAQSVERITHKDVVVGSIPTPGTKPVKINL